MTATEGSVVAGIGYLLYLLALKIGCFLVEPMNRAYAALPSVDCLRTPTAQKVIADTAMGIGVAGLTGCGLFAFVLWSRYNYQRCQDFWTKQIQSEAPLLAIGVTSIIGKVSRKPPKAMCVVGSPLVTVLELGAIGGIIWLLTLFWNSLPAASAPVYTSPAEWEAHLRHEATLTAIGNDIGVVMLMIIAIAIFAIWTKWNYTLCRRYWGRA